MSGSYISQMTKSHSKATSGEVSSATMWSQSAKMTDQAKEDKWAARRAMIQKMKSNWGTVKK
jgi:hypothetical protein